MRLRHLVLVALLAIIGAIVWRSELWTVASPGAPPRPLTLLPLAERRSATVDVVLPAVPIGSQHLTTGASVLLVHYWAPWERHSREQAHTLDSLQRLPEMIGVRIVVACCDPFPSVTRYVVRERLRLNVLMDGAGELRRVLPCPSVPYTYVIDRAGQIVVAQAGEIDWLAPETRRVLAGLLKQGAPTTTPI